MIDPECPICFGLGWVCKNYPKRVWDEQKGCQCGAGMPCECVRADRLEEPGVRIRAKVCPNSMSRPGGHRTALFRNCRFVTGSIA